MWSKWPIIKPMIVCHFLSSSIIWLSIFNQVLLSSIKFLVYWKMSQQVFRCSACSIMNFTCAHSVTCNVDSVVALHLSWIQTPVEFLSLLCFSPTSFCYCRYIFFILFTKNQLMKTMSSFSCEEYIRTHFMTVISVKDFFPLRP